MTRPTRWCAAVFLASLIFASVAGAADPFYDSLLRRGIEALDRADYTTAAKRLRVAAFGYLDQPEQLVQALSLLAVAQAGLGDQQAFTESFRRIAEIEERFGGYTKSPLPAERRRAFEGAVVRLIPEATLRATTGFSFLLPKVEDQLSAMSPRQRRQELARLVKSEPKEPKWLAMTAEQELENGELQAAVNHADAALALAPSLGSAWCTKGLVLSAEKKWPLAVDSLEKCPKAGEDARVAEALMRGLGELGRWQDVAALFAQLPAKLQAQKRLGGLAERASEEVKRGAAAGAVSPTPSAANGGASARASASPPQTATPRPAATAVQLPSATVASPLTPTARRRTSDLTSPPAVATQAPSLPARERRQLDRAIDLAGRGQLIEGAALAREIADRYPTVPEAQHVAGELLYRLSRWQDAVDYFRRGGDPGDERPLRLFYLAVALYETGDRTAAADALRRCLPSLRRTEYVESYVAKVLGPAGGS